MSAAATLQGLLDASAVRFPTRIAVEDPEHAAISYGDLAALSDRLRDRLRHIGVRPGDRVGIYMRKSIDAIAGIFGVLKAGATYVPVDPDAPAARCAYILDNCAVRAVLTERRLEGALRGELASLSTAPEILVLEDGSDTVPLRALLDETQRRDPAATTTTAASAPDDLAYILYTSGSTGKPKGVMLTQRAAFCFIDWCSETFHPTEDDVFSSHAPLHFDLSVHDVFVSMKHGARLVLIGEQIGKDPLRLASLIAAARISIWYSTPSILAALASYGKLERHDYDALRLVLFAGEVFPIPGLRAIKASWPRARYFNLYGPTETNVCTYYEIPERIPDDRIDPFPIGRICPPLRGRVVDERGGDVRAGEEGELVIAGPGVMSGYWNLPDRNGVAFLAGGDGERWYRTGDLVIEDADGIYHFHGRRDRMVKRRGYRIELGEIESGLTGHPDVREVAVVAQAHGDGGVRIIAYLGLREGCHGSVIAFKQYSAEHLPRYMVPDAFVFIPALPRTSTDKIDYQTLKAHA